MQNSLTYVDQAHSSPTAQDYMLKIENSQISLLQRSIFVYYSSVVLSLSRGFMRNFVLIRPRIGSSRVLIKLNEHCEKSEFFHRFTLLLDLKMLSVVHIRLCFLRLLSSFTRVWVMTFNEHTKQIAFYSLLLSKGIERNFGLLFRQFKTISDRKMFSCALRGCFYLWVTSKFRLK